MPHAVQYLLRCQWKLVALVIDSSWRCNITPHPINILHNSCLFLSLVWTWFGRDGSIIAVSICLRCNLICLQALYLKDLFLVGWHNPWNLYAVSECWHHQLPEKWCCGPPLFGKAMLWSSPEVRSGGWHRHPMLFWPKIEPLYHPRFWHKITWDVYESP